MNTLSKILLEKEYCGESLCDVERDVYEALSWPVEDKDIPTDKYNIPQGTFKITITWTTGDE